MKLLITGSAGQLGQILVPILEQTDTVFPKTKEQLDITQIEQVKEILEELRPDCVINLAAFTQVELAETQGKVQCYTTNTKAVEGLAYLCYSLNIRLIHISTNYVFSGKYPKLYTEQDIADPINYYGYCKLKGEEAALRTHKNTIILRTSSLYSPAGENFVTKVLKKIKLGEEIGVLEKASTQPTSCEELAFFIAALIQQPQITGILHYTGEEYCSWYLYAQLIRELYTINSHKPAPPIVPLKVNRDNLRPPFALLNNQLRKNLSHRMSPALAISLEKIIVSWLQRTYPF